MTVTYLEDIVYFHLKINRNTLYFNIMSRLSVTFFHGLNLRRNTTQGWTIRRKVQETSRHA